MQIVRESKELIQRPVQVALMTYNYLLMRRTIEILCNLSVRCFLFSLDNFIRKNVSMHIILQISITVM